MIFHDSLSLNFNDNEEKGLIVKDFKIHHLIKNNNK